VDTVRFKDIFWLDCYCLRTPPYWY